MKKLPKLNWVDYAAIVIIILVIVIIISTSCTEAPFEPIATCQEQVDSLQLELEKVKLTAQRWSYIAQCNAQWFEKNGIEPPCHGNPIQGTI